jgi:hypothetical protein
MTDEPKLAARVEAELRGQGLRRAVGDPAVIRQIASLLGAEDPRAREKRLAAIRAELAEMELRLRLDDAVGRRPAATPGEAGDDTS